MLRIGLAQMDIKLGDREANFAAVEEWMKKYWTPSETETAVVLPEMFDVGYVIDEAEKYADRGAERAAEVEGAKIGAAAQIFVLVHHRHEVDLVVVRDVLSARVHDERAVDRRAPRPRKHRAASEPDVVAAREAG